MLIQQGDIFWVDLNPTKGKEQQGLRPCVVVSGDTMNQRYGLSLICPLTTSLKHYFAGLILEPNEDNGLKKTSEVLSFQLKIADHGRFRKRIGKIAANEMQTLLKGISLVLTY